MASPLHVSHVPSSDAQDVHAIPKTGQDQIDTDTTDDEQYFQMASENKITKTTTFLEPPKAEPRHRRADSTWQSAHPRLLSLATSPRPVPPRNRLASTAPVRYCKLLKSWRFVTALLLMYSLIVSNILKNSLGMALICMTGPTSTSTQNVSGKSMSNASDDISILSGEKLPYEHHHEFHWEPDILGWILASINVQFLSPIFGDFIRGYIGNKLTLTIIYSLCAVLLFLSPIAARSSPYYFTLMCILRGCVVQANFVVLGDMLPWWSPANEKIILAAIIYSGMSLSGLVGNVLAGLLCMVPIDNGWPFIFYAFGTITLVWVILWVVCSSRTPEEHPFISKKEANYIIAQRTGMDDASSSKMERPPYGSIFKSGPIWAYLICGWCFFWFLTGMLSYLPIFLGHVQHFKKEIVGILMGMFCVTSFIGNIFWTSLGKYLRKCYNRNKSRKICISAGCMGSGALTVVLGSLVTTINKWVSYALIHVIVLLLAVGVSTLTIVSVDMAPRYAGFITAIWMSSSTLVSISAPLTMAWITPTNSLEEWEIAFFVFGGVIIFGTAVFTIFGEALIQSWAICSRDDTPENESTEDANVNMSNL